MSVERGGRRGKGRRKRSESRRMSRGWNYFLYGFIRRIRQNKIKIIIKYIKKEIVPNL
jgi:hypothetical protein